MVLSSQIRILCGQLQMPWESLLYALEGCALYGYPDNSRLLQSHGLENIIQMERCRCLGANLSLDIVLETMRNLSAFEPNDKVYASSFISVLGNRFVELDYDKPAPRSYIDAAITLNHESWLLDYPFVSLSMVDDRTDTGASSDELRSWVPNWESPLLTYRLNTRSSALSASKNLANVRSDYQSSRDELHFEGVVCDQLLRLASSMPPRRLCDKYSVSGVNSIVFLDWFDWVNENRAVLGNPSRDV